MDFKINLINQLLMDFKIINHYIKNEDLDLLLKKEISLLLIKMIFALLLINKQKFSEYLTVMDYMDIYDQILLK